MPKLLLCVLTGTENGATIDTGVRYREGHPVKPIDKTYEMALNKTEYAHTVAEKYCIHLRGSGQKITIRIDEKVPQLGKSVPDKPAEIILGSAAFTSEEELANTIAHELNHTRARPRGIDPEEPPAYNAGDSLVAYIRGER